MYLEIYPDIIFILNFFLDFIILTILKMINRKDSRIMKRILAATIGALAAATTGIFPWINIIVRFILMNIGVAALMLILSFGRMKKADLMKQLISLYLITYFFGGLANSILYHTELRILLINLGNSMIYSNIPGLFIIGAALLTIPVIIGLRLIFRWYQSNRTEILEVELFYKSRSVRVMGLVDNGNNLYDPIFKKPVIVLENNILTKLLSLEENEEFADRKALIEENATSLEQRHRVENTLLSLKFIPYQSIGKKHGMMLGLVLDKVLIYQEKETICNEKITAAICDNCLSEKEEYHVILHKELFSSRILF